MGNAYAGHRRNMVTAFHYERWTPCNPTCVYQEGDYSRGGLFGPSRPPPPPQWAAANWQQARPVILPLIAEAGRILTALYSRRGDCCTCLNCVDMSVGQALVPEIGPRLNGALAPYGLSALIVPEKIHRGNKNRRIIHMIFINYHPGGPVAPPPRMPQGLMPPGWTTAVDAQGRTYFIDHNTRTTTYNPPPPAPHGPPPPAHVYPPGAGSQAAYGPHGGAATHMPPAGQDGPPPPYSPTGQSSGVMSQQPAMALPQGWERVVDAQGQPYFINHNNQTTQREPPPSAPGPVEHQTNL